MARNLARVRLEIPVEVGRRKFTELRVRAPRPGDAATVGYDESNPTDESAFRLVAHLAGVPFRVIEELAPRDLKRVTAAIRASVPDNA